MFSCAAASSASLPGSLYGSSCLFVYSSSPLGGPLCTDAVFLLYLLLFHMCSIWPSYIISLVSLVEFQPINCLFACLSPHLLCLLPFFPKLNVFISIELLQHLVPIGEVDLKRVCSLLVTQQVHLALVALVGGLQCLRCSLRVAKTIWWSDAAFSSSLYSQIYTHGWSDFLLHEHTISTLLHECTCVGKHCSQ